MDRVSLRFNGAIIATIIISLMFALMPLPVAIEAWKPEWIALTLIYWAITLPKQISLFLAWFLGLLIDTLYGTILGQHALGFTIVLYFAMRFSERINPQIIWQQLFMISLVLSVYLLINLWILGITGNSPSTWAYWLSLFGSILIWPVWQKFLKLFVITRKHL